MAKTASKNRKVATIQNTEVLEAVADLDLDGVSNNITTTQVEVQKSLASLSAKLTEQLQQLRDIEVAIRLRQEELEPLRDIELADTTLDDLQSTIVSTRQQWEEEKQRQQREFAEQRADRNRAWQRGGRVQVHADPGTQAPGG